MGGRKTVGVIIGEAIGLYRRNFKVFFITTLIAYGVAWLFLQGQSWLTDVLGLDSKSVGVWMSPDHIERSIAGWGLGPVSWPIVLLASMAGLVFFFTVSMALMRLFAIPGDTLNVGAYDVMLGINNGRKRSAKEAVTKFKGNWQRYLGISAWSSLFIWLWSLLFLIPGLIKTYAYLLAPFLILDYPDMTVRKALKKSIEITNGYKGRLFGLQFIVGLPLGILSALLGFVFMVMHQLPTYSVIVNITFPIASLLLFQPVTYMMYTIAYLDIKRAAIERGLLP